MTTLDYDSYYTYSKVCFTNEDEDETTNPEDTNKPSCYGFQFQYQPVESMHNIVSKSRAVKLPVYFEEYINCVNELNNILNKQIGSVAPTQNSFNVYDTMSFKTAISDDFTAYVEHIAQVIIPEIETQLYGCNLQLSRYHIYQNKFTNGEVDELNTNVWHWDNHPNTVINVIIYLEDIDHYKSHIQILEHNGRAITMPTNRTGTKNWGPKTHMRYKKCQLNGTHLREFMYYGYKPLSIVGSAGSCLIFSKNIIHRHNLLPNSTSNMLCLQLKPVHVRQDKYVTDKTKNVFDLEVDPSPI
jgi:hypothetical protein